MSERQHSPAARCARVLLALLRRGTASTAELARDVESDRRRVLSDLQLLIEVAPIAHVGRGVDQRWTVDESFRLGSLGMLNRIALQLGRQMADFLRGTDLVAAPADFAPLDGLPARYQRNLDRKLRLLREAARSYGGSHDEMGAVLDGLLRERLLDLQYQSLAGERRWEGVRPLTLVVFRRAVYLMASHPDWKETRNLAVDRIVGARVGEPFEYPADWHPDRVLGSYFGIHTQPAPALVRLRFSAKAAPLVSARSWHPSQQFQPTDDGGVILQMHCGGQELVSFVLEWGPQCQVLEPPWLVAAVLEDLRGALAAYPGAADR